MRQIVIVAEIKKLLIESENYAFFSATSDNIHNHGHSKLFNEHPFEKSNYSGTSL